MDGVPDLVLAGAAIGLTALVLLMLGWIATRRFTLWPKLIVRALLVALVLAPFVFLVLTLEGPGEMASAPSRPEAAERRAPDARPPVIGRTRELEGAAPADPPAPGAARPPSTGGARVPDGAAPAEPPAPGAAQPRSATPKRSATQASDAVDGQDWQVVPVYYGTDRTSIQRTAPNAAAPAASVGPDYSAGRARRLELGQALVTVPKVHQVPAIERPWVYRIPLTGIVIYAEKQDPRLHFTLQSVGVLSRADFLARVRERLAASRAYEGHALVFVHGYNTTFDYALYRTAQIAYDLGFDGAPFVYSWPSQGQITGYPYDRESAEQAQPHLKEFLEIVTRETGAKSVSIIAHSMGNQLLLPVLRELKRSSPPGVVVSELILAAPDVGRDTFAFLAGELKGFAKGVTLYASGADRALLASRQFWSSARAGEVPPEGPFVLPGIETIDVTSLSTDVFGLNHSGFAERTALLDDIGQLIRANARPPESRKTSLVRIGEGVSAFWRYQPTP